MSAWPLHPGRSSVPALLHWLMCQCRASRVRVGCIGLEVSARPDAHRTPTQRVAEHRATGISVAVVEIHGVALTFGCVSGATAVEAELFAITAKQVRHA